MSADKVPPTPSDELHKTLEDFLDEMDTCLDKRKSMNHEVLNNWYGKLNAALDLVYREESGIGKRRRGRPCLPG
jgi:hypothetical protein